MSHCTKQCHIGPYCVMWHNEWMIQCTDIIYSVESEEENVDCALVACLDTSSTV